MSSSRIVCSSAAVRTLARKAEWRSSQAVKTESTVSVAPALIVVGQVVKLQNKLDWFVDAFTEKPDSTPSLPSEKPLRI